MGNAQKSVFNVYYFNKPWAQLMGNHENGNLRAATTTTLSPATLERIFMINSKDIFSGCGKQMEMDVIEVAREKLIR